MNIGNSILLLFTFGFFASCTKGSSEFSSGSRPTPAPSTYISVVQSNLTYNPTVLLTGNNIYNVGDTINVRVDIYEIGQKIKTGIFNITDPTNKNKVLQADTIADIRNSNRVAIIRETTGEFHQDFMIFKLILNEKIRGKSVGLSTEVSNDQSSAIDILQRAFRVN